MRLLVVEDDAQISDGLTRALRRSGYAVDAVADGNLAISALRAHPYDLVVLDLGLPGVDGLAVLKSLRSHSVRHVPVVVLTARDELEDRLKGLDGGADDYIVKPFELPELEARIRAVMRRTLAGTGRDVAVGALVLHPAERRISLHGQPVDLLPREFGVLEALMLRKGQVVSKAQLQDHLCDWRDELTDSAIELYVHRIRRKIESSGVQIRTVRGFGYLLEGADGS